MLNAFYWFLYELLYALDCLLYIFYIFNELLMEWVLSSSISRGKSYNFYWRESSSFGEDKTKQNKTEQNKTPLPLFS